MGLRVAFPETLDEDFSGGVSVGLDVRGHDLWLELRLPYLIGVMSGYRRGGGAECCWGIQGIAFWCGLRFSHEAGCTSASLSAEVSVSSPRKV